MHGSFQSKNSFVYKLIFSVSRNTWHIIIGTLQLKNDEKHILCVNLKNINTPLVAEQRVAGQ
jgi:hypothetical protein